MKKNKDNLLLSAILIIVYTIFTLLYSLRKSEFLTGEKFKSIASIIQLILSFAGCTYFIYLSSNKSDLKKHSIGILIFSIIFFIINIVSGVIGYSVYKKISPKSTRKLPVLDDVIEHKSIIYLLSLIICLVLLFCVAKFISNFVELVLLYVSILMIMVITFRKRIVRDFKEFKEYFKEYNSLVLKTWGLSLLTLFVINIFIRLITNLDNSSNQETLNLLFEKSPLLILFLTTIYAPMAEELMFRGVFQIFIKNKWAFILISGFVFGLVHVIDDFQTISELLYIFVYASLGCYLAYLYQKTNNIFTNIYFHFLQNSLSILLMFITTFLK